nr:unnamed protein product [Digitaria exilis]
MTVEFTDCKILLVDKKITDASEIIRILDSAVKENYPLVIVAEDVEEAAMADLIKNKLKGTIKVAAVKAFSFGEQKTQCLDDIAVMTGGTVVRDDMGYSLEKAGKEVLGSASKVGAQTVIEMKDKKLRIEDALNATRAAIEEGVVVGGGCSLLRLSEKIDAIKESSLDNIEQKIGADIFKQALSYPTSLIANNAGMNVNQFE